MKKEIYNTFGIKAFAKEFIEYDDEQMLIAAVPSLKDSEVLHVGGGSNLLFLGDFDGVVLHSRIRTIEMVEEDERCVVLRVGSGVVWDDFVAYSVEHGWSGAENLSLIPGEVGASAVQNIGAYGVEAKDLIVSVDCVSLIDGTKRVFSNEECRYGYRKSIFKAELKGLYAVTYVTYRLSKCFEPKLEYGNISKGIEEGIEVTAEVVRDVVSNIRRAKLPDPQQLGNAGSFFMNPVVSNETFERIRTDYPNVPFYMTDGGVKIPAGWMIEQCGWKGKNLGRAGVYEKQALILVNLGGATGKEIVELCEAVRKSVKDKFDVDIHPEVNFV